MLDRICIMGRLTRDPELKNTQSGKNFCNITVAVERDIAVNGHKDADFFDVVIWDKTAEFVAKFFQKGRMIYVDGRMQSRTFKDKDGNNRKAWEVVAQSVGFCGDHSDTMQNEVRPTRSASDFGGLEDEDDNKVPF